MAPKVSIILPSYNYACYLPQRIDSLLAQSYSDFELIITDDASTDESREVISRYEDPRIKTTFYDVNSGCVCRRWNDAAELAQGDYILFAGADDYCKPEMVERLVEPLDRHASVVVAYCDSQKVDGDGNVGPRYGDKIHHAFRDALAKSIVPGLEMRRLMFCHGFLFRTCSALMFRKAVLDAAGGFDLKFRIVADWWLVLEMLKAGDFAYIPDALNYFRKHDVQASSAKKPDGVIEIGAVLNRRKDQPDIDPVLKVDARRYFLGLWRGKWRNYGWQHNLTLLKLTMRLGI